VKVTTNADRLARQVLAGEIWPPLADRHAYRVGPDGQPFLLPGMGGVTLDVHCGDPATGYAADHLEPGASIRHRDPGANMALQFLTCVGNQVTVVSRPAAGVTGHVIGQHAYVLADFPGLADTDTDTGTGTGAAAAEGPGKSDTAADLATGDAVTVLAVGQGLGRRDGLRVRQHRPDGRLRGAGPGPVARP
jgi:Domain of unknown function (DUF4438), N-terminal